MKLTKLVYIAHGWAFVTFERGLFNERIEAWKYGPVVPTIYQATKRFGRKEIPLNLIEETEPSPLDKDTQAFLEDLFDKYGDLSGIELSRLTHEYGSPWHQVYVPNVPIVEIPDKLIREYYLEKYEQYQQNVTAIG